MNNYGAISTYWQAIESGSVTVGKWVRLQYEMLIRDLDSGAVLFDEKKAKKATRFIENFVHHHEGPLAPRLLKLELWQQAAVAAIFGIVDPDGFRHFREVFIVVARKNGKTLFAAGVAEYMTYADGEYGARIYFTAPKLQQAEICYNAYYQSIKKEPDLDAITKKRRTDVYVEQSNTSAQPLAYSAKKSDGLNVSLGVCDEVAAWGGVNGIKFYEVLKSSQGARKQPLLLSITTAGYENDGIYDELVARATRSLNGNSKEKRLFALLYMIDDITLWNDPEELKKSNPNLGISVTLEYLMEEAAVAELSASKKAEFITKYACLKQNSSQAWLAAELVERARGVHMDLADFKECYGVAGLDLSQTTDLTAAVFVFERGGKLNVLARFFMPAELIDTATERDGIPYQKYVDRGELVLSGDNFVDYHDCESFFSEAIDLEAYPLYIGYDRYSAQYLVQDMKGNGFHMDDVYQGENLWGVIQEFEGLMKDGLINIGDNELLAIHLLDCAIKMSLERGRGKLVKIDHRSHIDGAAALIDAMCVRQKWWHEIGAQLRANDPEPE